MTAHTARVTPIARCLHTAATISFRKNSNRATTAIKTVSLENAASNAGLM
jgi:hypothetical protein